MVNISFRQFWTDDRNVSEHGSQSKWQSKIANVFLKSDKYK